MKITLVQRRPFSEQFSVEGYFDRVASGLRELGEVVDQMILPRYSQGFFPRLQNVRAVKPLRTSADVVHIAGDVHYVAMGSDPSKTVLTVLDCGTLFRLKGMRRLAFKYLWLDMPTRRCRDITVISNETKKQLLENVRGLESSKVHVIPVSISEKFQFEEKSFSDSNPRILQIGTKGNKNLERTFQALEGIPCTLSIVGSLSNEQIEVLQSLNLKYESRVGISEDDVLEEYRKCDIVTFASTIEGFGMPIVEGQLMGRPVITSKISSMPEVAGEGGCLVDPWDVSSIRHGFQRIIHDASYREELIRKGRINGNRFSAIEIAKQFLSVYRRNG